MPIASSGNVISSSNQLGANVVLTGAIKDGEIVNNDISAAAAIAIGKLSGVAASGANNDITSLTGLTTALAVNKGGTGADAAAGARTNLGLGGMAVQEANNVAITGGTISGVPGLGATVVLKASDEGVTSSTVLQDDNHLVFAGVANKMYMVKLFLLLNDPNTDADFKFNWGLPAGATFDGKRIKVEADGNDDISEAADWIEDVIDGNDKCVIIVGVIKIGGNAGNCTLKWAQNASRGSATYVKAGSYLEYYLMN